MQNNEHDIVEDPPGSKSNNEEKLTALIQNGVDLIGILDEQGNYKYTSPSVKSILGYQENYLIDKSPFEFIHPDDVAFVKQQFVKVLAGEEIKVSNFRFRHADGSYRWIDTLATNLLNNPAVKGIVVTSRDTTERKEKEEERELLISELIRNNNDLKQFSFIASHNLMAPLSNIKGLLSLINPDSLDSATAEIIHLLEDSTSQLTRIIHDISDILVLKNNVNIALNYIDIQSVFGDVNNIFFSAENNISASITTNFEVKEIYFEKTYLESIFTNLISNAIKYRSPERPLEINIRTYKNKEGNTILVFSDNGIGIDISRNKARIFGMYQRFHQHVEGTGLGLFIVKSQIEALKGKIDIESEVNRGTSFIITFADSVSNNNITT